VADVVIGLLQMEKVTAVWVKKRALEPKFDYYCWICMRGHELFYGRQGAREKMRSAALRTIEDGKGEVAEVAQVVRMRLSAAICARWRG